MKKLVLLLFSFLSINGLYAKRAETDSRFQQGTSVLRLWQCLTWPRAHMCNQQEIDASNTWSRNNSVEAMQSQLSAAGMSVTPKQIERFKRRIHLHPPVNFRQQLQEFPARKSSTLTIMLQEPLTVREAQPMSAYLHELNRNFLEGTLLKEDEMEEAKRYVTPYSRIRELKGDQPHRGMYINEVIIQNNNGTKQLVLKRFPGTGKLTYTFIQPGVQEQYDGLYFLNDKVLKELMAGNNF
jgi:hypothetical protein